MRFKGRKGLAVSLSFVLLTGISCDSSQDPDPAVFGYDYLEMALGAWQEFEVTETEYALSVPVEHAYQLRAEVSDFVLNPAGDTVWVVAVSRRETPMDAWEPHYTATVRIAGRQGIADWDGAMRQVLTFPPEAGAAWNGNAVNSQEADSYEITESGVAFTTDNGLNFPDVVTVLQEDNQDVIVQMDFRQERYARGVGLVSKEVTLLNYCTQPSCLGQQKIESGRVYKQQIIAYGRI
jgi:hypothetical protein